MLNFLSKKSASLLLTALLLNTSCLFHNTMLIKLDNSNLTIVIPEEITLDKNALYFSLAEGSNINGIPAGWGIELIVLGFTTGREVYSVSAETGDIINRIEQGKMDALIKVRDHGKLKKVFFVKSCGSSEKEILKELAYNFKQVLRHI